MMRTALVATASLAVAAAATTFAKIDQLPGYSNALGYSMYSGYLNVRRFCGVWPAACVRMLGSRPDAEFGVRILAPSGFAWQLLLLPAAPASSFVVGVYLCCVFTPLTSLLLLRVQVDPVSDRNIFFWMVEGLTEEAKKNVIFWTNGGPGCSGMEGLLGEMGFARVMPAPNSTSTTFLADNPWTWASFATMVFLEQVRPSSCEILPRHANRPPFAAPA